MHGAKPIPPQILKPAAVLMPDVLHRSANNRRIRIPSLLVPLPVLRVTLLLVIQVLVELAVVPNVFFVVRGLELHPHVGLLAGNQICYRYLEPEVTEWFFALYKQGTEQSQESRIGSRTTDSMLLVL